MGSLRDQFTTDGGVFVDWARVIEVGFGTVIGAIFSGWVAIVLNLADVPLALLDGFGEFLGAFVEVTLGLPAFIARGAWGEAAAFVADAGPAGFVAALAIVLVTFWVFWWVVRRV